MKTNILRSLIIVATSCLGHVVSAQTLQDEKNIFRIEVGVMRQKTLDLQYSPRVYKSISPSLGFIYSREKKKGLFDVSLKLRTGSLSPSDGDLQSVYITDTDFDGNDGMEVHDLEYAQMSAALEVGYLHHIVTHSKPRWFVGGSLVENFTYTPSIIYIGTINYASLNLRGRMDYPLNNGKLLSLGISFPVLSVVTRMPYHNAPIYPNKSGIGAFFTGNNEVVTMNSFQNESFFVRYQWFKSEKISMDVQYESNWLYSKKPERLTASYRQISIGINL